MIYLLGTQTSLLKPRIFDFGNKSFHNWPFMSISTWGENPFGDWIIKISDEVNSFRSTFKRKIVKNNIFCCCLEL
jgi:subtilisin-like proprotein convertase family protein